MPDIKVEDHYGLVHKFARGYSRRMKTDMHTEDLVQEGMIGVMRAAELFDPSQGFKFGTYAAYWIRHMMTRYLEKNIVMVRTGSIEDTRIRLLSGQLEAMVYSLDDPMNGDIENDSFKDHLVDKEPLPDEVIEKEEMRAAIRKIVDSIMETPRDADIISSRLMAEKPQTLEVVSSRHGVSKQAIGQREEKLIRKIKPALLKFIEENGGLN